MHSVKEILSSSFEDNFSIIYAVGSDRARRDALIDYSIHQAQKAGKVYHRGSSAALILFKDKKASFISNLIPTLTLILKGLRSNTLKISKKEKVVESVHKKYNIPEDAVYLWYIGTHPLKQGEGTGSKLLSKIIDEFKDKTIILETSVERNVDWYHRFGFVVYHVERFEGRNFYFLKREQVLG